MLPSVSRDLSQTRSDDTNTVPAQLALGMETESEIMRVHKTCGPENLRFNFIILQLCSKYLQNVTNKISSIGNGDEL